MQDKRKKKETVSITLVELEMALPQKHMTRYFYFLSLKEQEWYFY